MADYQSAVSSVDPSVSQQGPLPETHLHDVEVEQPTGITLDNSILEILRKAALSSDRSDGLDALHAVLSFGISREDIADRYIPQVARQLGDLWCSDEMGFATVTIGTSRLQSMLRSLGPDWSGNQNTDPDAPAVMLIVPPNVSHTLGAMVLAGQLRRKGVSVRLMLGANHREVADRVKTNIYDAFLISSSRGDLLETVRKTIDAIRTAAKKTPPIVIGGSLLEQETKERVMAQTGADHATEYLDEALEFCGLTKAPHCNNLHPTNVSKP